MASTLYEFLRKHHGKEIRDRHGRRWFVKREGKAFFFQKEWDDPFSGWRALPDGRVIEVELGKAKRLIAIGNKGLVYTHSFQFEEQVSFETFEIKPAKV